VLRDSECCFFGANLAQDVQLAATLTPDGPVQIIIDCVTPQINPFRSHLFVTPSLPPSSTFRSNHPLSSVSDQAVFFPAPSSPGGEFVRYRLTARCVLQCGRIDSVTASLDAAVGPSLFNARTLAGYPFCTGRWGTVALAIRCRSEPDRPRINGHRDFVFATRIRTLQLLSCSFFDRLVGKKFSRHPQTNQPMLAVPLPQSCTAERNTRAVVRFLSAPEEQA
jgi:hypothetical protein